MKITLSPVASNRTTAIAVNGDRIIVDGQEFDLSALPDDSLCDATYPAVGPVKRIAGIVHVTIIYHYDSALAESVQPTDLAAYSFDITTGVVPCPILWRPAPEVMLVPEDNLGAIDD